MNLPLFNMKKWILMIGIAIVFNLFINYGLSTIYKAPDYEQFCNQSGGSYKPYPYPAERYLGDFVKTNSTCPEVRINGTMRRECNQAGGAIITNYDDQGCPTSEYCEMCYKQADDARRKYDANVFIILVGLGALTVIGGIFVSVESVGGGFLLGGILLIIIGAMRSWANLHEYIRLLFLGLALALLIFVGYKKIK